MTNTYVLVHGAWMGKFCWTEVASKLEGAGQQFCSFPCPIA
jgi:hypothetical protein